MAMETPWGFCQFCGTAIAMTPMADGCVHCRSCGRYGRPVVNAAAVTICVDPPIDPLATQTPARPSPPPATQAPAPAQTPRPKELSPPPAISPESLGAARTFLIEDQVVSIPGHLIIEEIGRGGMGSVYRARRLKTGQTVAVKVLSQKLAARESFVLRFQREARAQALAAHPNVVEVFEQGECDGLFYFTMEYVEGVSLRHWVTDGQFSGREFFSLAAQTCCALDHIHGQRMIHRDIKPENIMIDRTRAVKLGDFGLVDVVDTEGHEANLTRTRAVLGTINYMAPEQAIDSSRVTNQVDIYSVGVVLYELLTGRVPQGRFDPPSLLNHLIDPRLDEPILKALEVEPKKRYPTVRALLSKLESISASLTPEQLERAWGHATAAREKAQREKQQVDRGEKMFEDMMAARGGAREPDDPALDTSDEAHDSGRTSLREAQFVGVWRGEREKRMQRQESEEDELSPEEQRMEGKLQALHLQRLRKRKQENEATVEAKVPPGPGSSGRWWKVALGLLVTASVVVAGVLAYLGRL